MITLDGQDLVLDPTIAQKGKKGGALTKSEWLALLNADQFTEVPSADLTKFFVDKATNTYSGSIDHQNVSNTAITNVQDMPPFKEDRFLDTFSRLDESLILLARDQTISVESRDMRRASLFERTLKLVPLLRELKLLIVSDKPVADLYEALFKINQEHNQMLSSP